ncbi:MAG: Eco57I restriction-modification methylase domain-containing protein [Candidatus Anammoxibacter sp.]
MNKALEIYSYILKEHFSKCFANRQNIDPIELNKERFNTKALFTAAIIFLKNNYKREDYKIISATNKWFKISFAEENIFSAIIENASEGLINVIENKMCNLVRVESIDVSTLYEALLSIESGNESNGAKISTAKNYRNKLGSYYTPDNLARAVTKKTINTFFELNFGIKKLSDIDPANLNADLFSEVPSISFADFSCGSGNFLIEVICYFERLFAKLNLDEKKVKDLLKSIVLNISAFDVDCLALEIAKLNLLLRIQQPNLYCSLSDKFIHANFLLQTDFAVDETKKTEMFSGGFIYHEHLALHKSKIKKYDVILGNPPWEKIRFEEKRFYALYANSIANNHFKSSRTTEINETELKNVLLAKFSKQFKHEIKKAKSDLKQNPFFSLSNNGELNTYALFTEAAMRLKTKRGVVGLVVKSAIVTSQVNQNLFKHLSKEKLVVAIYDFINRKKIFIIDSRERFCFLLIGNSPSNRFSVSMNLKDVDDIEKERTEFELSFESLKLMNPITGMLPNFSTKEEAGFLMRVSCDFPIFKNVFGNVRFGRIVHFTSHTEFISKKGSNDNLPIYEGKFFNQFDGKFSGFNKVGDELKYRNKSSSVVLDEIKKANPDYFPESRFFINREKWLQLSQNHSEKFMLAWRSLTSATNIRTCIATILPFIPASQSVQFLTTNSSDLLYLAGLFNSVVFDFIIKKKLSGIDLTQSVINQIPVPEMEQLATRIMFDDCKASIKEHIALLVFSLLRNDIRLNNLFLKMHLDDHHPICECRFEIIRKLDLLFMFLFQLNNSELELVLATFSKQYSKKDLVWFKDSLEAMRLKCRPPILKDISKRVKGIISLLLSVRNEISSGKTGICA